MNAFVIGTSTCRALIEVESDTNSLICKRALVMLST